MENDVLLSTLVIIVQLTYHNGSNNIARILTIFIPLLQEVGRVWPVRRLPARKKKSTGEGVKTLSPPYTNHRAKRYSNSLYGCA